MLVSQIKDSMGRTVTYNYEAVANRLWRVFDPDGKAEQYTYDAAHRMTTVTDRRGNLMVINTYDQNGRVSQQTLADGAVWKFAYVLDASGAVVQTDVTNPRGYITRNFFNSSGHLIKRVLAVGQPEEQTYLYERQSQTNLLARVTDPLGRATEYAYDFMGNVTSVTRLAGTAEAVTDTFTFDTVFSEITSHTDPLSHTSVWSYDASGNLDRANDPLGNGSSFTFDALGRPSSFTNALGKTSSITYDGGDLYTTTDPLGRTTFFHSDAGGRVTGRRDPLGHLTKYGNDSFDRVTEVTDAVGGVTVVRYDEHGNMTAVTDPRALASHVYTYDERNRVSSYTDPLGKVESYTYDGMGNRTTRTDRKKQTTTYTYDPLNRVKTVTYADGSTITINWDTGNRPREIVDSINGIITKNYDGLDRLIQEVTPQGQIDYLYYANGLRKQMTVKGFLPVVYLYDNADRLEQISQGTAAVRITYDNADRRKSVTLPNGVTQTYTYDDADQLSSISYDNGLTHLGEILYEYGAAGRRTIQRGSYARTVIPGSALGNVFDAANRVTKWGASVLTYDDNGNMLTNGTATYSWNARDQLIGTSSGAGMFAYDSLGRRTTRTVSGVTYTYRHDGLNPVTYDGNFMLAGLGVDEYYARIAGTAVSSLLTDSLGSTIAVTNAAGASQMTYSFTPYGSVNGSGTGGVPFTYTGREADGTMLLYYRNRYYSAVMGRFISEDPIGLAGGYNVYAYVEGNPINLIDPYGLFGIADLPSIPQPAVDAAAGFGDALSFGLTDLIRDQMGTNGAVDQCSGAYSGGRYAGYAWGGTAGALRGAAALGGTRFGHLLNHNRYLRIGPGRMPANGGLPAGPQVPRLSIGSGPGNPHIDLRVRPID